MARTLNAIVFALMAFAATVQGSTVLFGAEAQIPEAETTPAANTGVMDSESSARDGDLLANELAELKGALQAADQKIEALQASQTARIEALERQLNELAKAYAAAEEQNSALLAASLQMSRSLAPLEKMSNDLRGEVARLAAVVAGLPADVETGTDADRSELAESLAALDARVSSLEAQIDGLISGEGATAVREPAGRGSAVTTEIPSADEPFQLVLDSTGNPAIRTIDQLERHRQDLVKASGCKTVGAWVTPRTAQGDNASFFVMDGRDIKVCRRIGEVWFALKENTDYPAFVVLQN